MIAFNSVGEGEVKRAVGNNRRIGQAPALTLSSGTLRKGMRSARVKGGPTLASNPEQSQKSQEQQRAHRFRGPSGHVRRDGSHRRTDRRSGKTAQANGGFVNAAVLAPRLAGVHRVKQG